MTIFSGYGVEVLTQNDQYFIKYDAGHFATEMQEREISSREAEQAQLSEADAYQVLLAVERRNVTSDTVNKDGNSTRTFE